MVEEFAIFEIKFSFLTDNLLRTQLKTAHKVGSQCSLQLFIFRGTPVKKKKLS